MGGWIDGDIWMDGIVEGWIRNGLNHGTFDVWMVQQIGEAGV